MINYGYQNEKDFVALFNDKYFDELDTNSQSFLKELFEENIGKEEKIKSWKNKAMQKTDIYIKYGNYIKGISLKCGNSNSVHCEPIQDFKAYLEKIKIPYKLIDKYVSYHYGYKKDKDNNVILSEKLSAEEYKKLYQKDIDEFNKYINKTKIIIDMIDRFIIRGKNSEYDIDALICGTVDNYNWILKYDIYDLILSNRRLDYTSPHIACMTIGPKRRDIFNDVKNSHERYLVVIRWNFIRELIDEYKNNKKLSL